MERSMVWAEQLRLIYQNDAGLQLKVEGMYLGWCEESPLLKTHRLRDNVLEVLIFTLAAPQQVCRRTVKNYQQEVVIGDIALSRNVQVVVNGVPVSDEAGPEPGYMRRAVVVEQVEVIVLNSTRLRLHVSGYHPEGCLASAIVEQNRDENHVSVRIYRDLPVTITCPMLPMPYEAQIELEGRFEPGTYTIDVNGFVVEVEL
jgi:hypothetical protein